MRLKINRSLTPALLMGFVMALAVALAPSVKAQSSVEALPFAGVIEAVDYGMREIVIEGARFQLGRLALARGDAGASAPGPEALEPGMQIEFSGALPVTPDGLGMIDALRIVPL